MLRAGTWFFVEVARLVSDKTARVSLSCVSSYRCFHRMNSNSSVRYFLGYPVSGRIHSLQGGKSSLLGYRHPNLSNAVSCVSPLRPVSSLRCFTGSWFGVNSSSQNLNNKLRETVNHKSNYFGRVGFVQTLRCSSTMMEVSEAVVRSEPGNTILTISLVIDGKKRNLDRPKDEMLDKTLFRMQKTASATGNGMKRNTKRGKTATRNSDIDTEQQQTPVVELHAGPSLNDPLVDPRTTKNEDAWKNGRILRLGSRTFTVEVNPPTIDNIEIQGYPFVGIPVVPTVKMSFAHVKNVEWSWWRNSGKIQNGKVVCSDEWENIHGAEGRMYIPSKKDAGLFLRVQAVPRRFDESDVALDKQNKIVHGNAAISEACGPVLTPPEPGPGSGRHEETLEFLASPSLRLVTYNILADQYASTESAKNIIFASCPSEFLDPKYRRPLVLGELLGYHPDIACLQEVDDRMCSDYLEPVLSGVGYAGIYTNKAGRVKEGSAMFWRSDRFSLFDHRDIIFRDLFPEASDLNTVQKAKYGPIFQDMLLSSPSLCTALQKVGTIAQIAILIPRELEKTNTSAGRLESSMEYKSSTSDLTSLSPFCLVNTHLFFHYAAPHIRTMHVFAALSEADEVIKNAMENPDFAKFCGDRKKVPIFFCGDLNSDLNDGIPGTIELLQSGKLSENYWDWHFGVHFRWDREESNQSEQKTISRDDGSKIKPAIGDVSNCHAVTHEDKGVGMDEGGEIQKMMHTDVEGMKPSNIEDNHCSKTLASRIETNLDTKTPHRMDIVPGVDLVAPSGPLASVDGLSTEVTNYVDGYEGLLDYIWYDPMAFMVKKIIPPQAKENLGGFLPSARFPSDHLAVVADLEFVDKTEANEVQLKGYGCTTNKVNEYISQSNSGVAPFQARMHLVGEAVNHIEEGNIILVPTDTIYGLACCANNSQAIKKIFEAKGRDERKPLAICVADINDVERYADISHVSNELLTSLLPGPVTLLLPRLPTAQLAEGVSAFRGSETVGLRIPDSLFVRAICRQYRGALALTSANRSGRDSPLSFDETADVLMHCKAAFDSGISGNFRSGSTIIDLTVPGQFSIVREGVNLEETVELLIKKFGLVDTTESK